MKLTKTCRGFRVLEHDVYAPKQGEDKIRHIVQESSAIGDYDDSMDKPGSSFLWIGEHHHLNRDEVRKMIAYMQVWLDTGRLGLRRGKQRDKGDDDERDKRQILRR